MKYSGEYARRIRAAVIAFLGGKCAVCGFSDFRALQIDHVDRSGYTRVKMSGRSYRRSKDRGITMHNAILRGTYPHRIQLLCANCNWIKRFENNEHGPVSH